jgi:hypothetical protein
MSTYEAVLHNDAARVSNRDKSITGVLTQVTGNTTGFHREEVLTPFLWTRVPILTLESWLPARPTRRKIFLRGDSCLWLGMPPQVWYWKYHVQESLDHIEHSYATDYERENTL